jgi:hypothetical protein
MRKKRCFAIGLQFNFWVAMTICNSLYFYTHKCYRTSCMNCNSLYIQSHFNTILYNSIVTIHFQLLCNSPITTTIISCWRHFSSIRQNGIYGTMKKKLWFFLEYWCPLLLFILNGLKLWHTSWSKVITWHINWI